MSLQYRCSRCGAVAAADTRAHRCTCGGLWDLAFLPPPFSLAEIDRSEWSQFRYRRFMALTDESWRSVSLGEGLTPITRLDGDVLLKMEYQMPTLSFKDRGAAALIAHCKAIGVDTVVQDSSGNAGNSIAAYAARAGIACEIFVPEGTSPKKIDMIRAHGARCTVVPGSRDHCADVCRAQVEARGAYYANHVYNPFFYEGTKTYIYETFEQLGRMPTNLVIPVGNGTLLLGAVYALEHLLRSGVIDRMPQLIAVQSAHCAPLLEAQQASLLQPAAVAPQPTLAEGIAIGQPARGEAILRLAQRHGIRFVAAAEADILPAREALARQGIYCEHTTAANYAGYLAYCRRYGPAPDCLIPMCGAGLKSDH